MTHEGARLIGLDWGTSQLRAYLLGERGVVLESRTHPWGVLSTSRGDFAAVYHAVVREWRDAVPDLPAIAAGMIGSTEGWVPAPYCSCPAGAAELAGAVVAFPTPVDGLVRVIPGVEMRGSMPDLMRGEETQVAGAIALRPELANGATVVLPGTHSKWVAVDSGRIAGFRTYMTGELFAVLAEHSILGRPAGKAKADKAPREAGADSPARDIAWEAFDGGVALARDGGSHGIAPLLFLTRSLVLREMLRAEDSLDFLSGLLIGDEVRAGLAQAAPNIVLVGARALCERYQRASAAFGIAAPVIDGTAAAGLWLIACRAGIVTETSHV